MENFLKHKHKVLKLAKSMKEINELEDKINQKIKYMEEDAEVLKKMIENSKINYKTIIKNLYHNRQ